MKRAVGYVRVSTLEQTKGFGLDVQEQAIRAWCKREGVRLAGLYRDEGVSGSNGLESREGFARAVAEIEAGRADVLVVYRLDRLARDLVLQETTIERLGTRGGRVASVTEPEYNSDDATRILVRQILGALAQYERALIRARLKAGRAAKKARDGYAGGRTRYGWRSVNGRLEREPYEQRCITVARKLRKDGASLRAIARVLDNRGCRTKDGRRWQATQVARILAPKTTSRP